MLEVDSIKCYLIAVILRNISIGINIARWFHTLSLTDAAKISKTKVKQSQQNNHKENKSIIIVLGIFIAVEILICLFMLIDFTNGKPTLNFT